eukprot:12560447-Prorocentrum_lima.AAC.1
MGDAFELASLWPKIGKEMQTTLTSAGGQMVRLLWQGGVLKHPKAILPALAWRVTSQRRLG